MVLLNAKKHAVLIIAGRESTFFVNIRFKLPHSDLMIFLFDELCFQVTEIKHFNSK